VRREAAADGLIVIGAAALFVSLFLSWSHLGEGLPALLGASAFTGLPRDPTAWQVYSSADVLLCLLAAALVAAGAFGTRRARQLVSGAAAVALAFVVHALFVPPTNGSLFADPSQNIPAYLPTHATAGPGETVALLGLLAALIGLGVSVLTERPAAPASAADVTAIRPPGTA
jgi:hypothetical protein